jgi:site-specific DNA-cytosine methylase
MRLQGFPDDWNEKGIMGGKVVEMSDTQRYKQAGNAVSVPIVSMVAERIKDGK